MQFPYRLEIKKIPNELPIPHWQFRRTWRIIRGCCQTRDLGRAGIHVRNVRYHSEAMGSSSDLLGVGLGLIQSSLSCQSHVGFMRSGDRWNLQDRFSTMSWKVRYEMSVPNSLLKSNSRCQVVILAKILPHLNTKWYQFREVI